MRGDDAKRFCDGCSKHVYNLSAMSSGEAEEFLRRAVEVPCLKFYRRTDGTILFENCPKGMRRIRDAVKYTWRAASLAIAFLLSIVSSEAEESKVNQPSNFNLEWTLSESGPVSNESTIVAPTQAPHPSGYLPQLGTADRYSFLNHWHIPQTKGLGADWSGADAFGKALKLVRQKKYARAEKYFREAITASSKPDSDPMYREFIGIEYADLLNKTGKTEEAKKILAQTRWTRATNVGQ